MSFSRRLRQGSRGGDRPARPGHSSGEARQGPDPEQLQRYGDQRIGPEDLRGVLVRRRWRRERGTGRREEKRQHGTDLRLGARQGVFDDVHGPGLVEFVRQHGGPRSRLEPRPCGQKPGLPQVPAGHAPLVAALYRYALGPVVVCEGGLPRSFRGHRHPPEGEGVLR